MKREGPIQGYGTAPGGYPSSYTENEGVKHWPDPEDMTPERADSMNAAKWAAWGKTPGVEEEEFLFVGEKP